MTAAPFALDALARVPDPFESLEQWHRAHHHDLEGMSRAGLLRERTRVRLRLAVDDEPPRWLLERLGRIEEALRAR